MEKETDELIMRRSSANRKDFDAMMMGTSSNSVAPSSNAYAAIHGYLQPVLEKVMPYVQLCCDKWKEFLVFIAPYRPELLLPSLLGIIMCFFGASFYALIAVYEAYRLCGYDTTVQCLNNLKEDFNNVVEINSKDDQVDDNEDGIVDVEQMTNQQLIVHKTLLFLKTVDPKRLTEALTGISAGFMAVMATLNIQLAMAITLGNSIGTQLEKLANAFIVPRIEGLLPNDYKKWAKPVILYSVKAMSIGVSIYVQLMIATVHSAIKGGLMFARNIITYVAIMKHVNINLEETYVDEALGILIAGVGIWWQLSNGLHLPFPFNYFLFPLTLLEYVCRWLIVSFSTEVVKVA